MATISCTRENCTIVETGICLESHQNPSSECPYYRPSPVEQGQPLLSVVEPPATTELDPWLHGGRAFHQGLELGVEDARALMYGRYVHLIGILGATNVGKTCFISSLYLLASTGALRPRYHFGQSLTLQGFEDRARLMRRWNFGGVAPEVLTEHTRLQDPRNPAFMHLALRENHGNGRKIDLLLSDLPGEWTTDLVRRASTVDRFRFLQRADGIVVMLEGPLLVSDSERHLEHHRATILLERLRADVHVSTTIPIVLVITKSDALGMQLPPLAYKINEHARNLGFQSHVLPLAAFSRNSDVPSGTGMHQILEALLPSSTTPSPWPTIPVARSDRAFSSTYNVDLTG